LEELSEVQPEDEAENPSTYIPSVEHLKRTFSIELTVCPCCGGCVTVMSAIIRKEAIQGMLGHLNIPIGPPARAGVCGTEYVCESFI
jgi:hypothetical protein